MAFSLTCQECGKLALGVFTRLRDYRGKLICMSCLKEHADHAEGTVTCGGLNFPAGSKICETCGKVSTPQAKLPGSAAVEVLLWLFFLLPGLIYSCWRRSKRHAVCPSCGGDHVIPLSTPKAGQLVEQYYS